MSLRIEVAGRAAAAALRGGSDVVVLAVFRRSCYVESPGAGLVCLGDASIGRGPLNAIVERFNAPRLSEVLEVSLQHAIIWQPAAMCGTWSRDAGERLEAAA